MENNLLKNWLVIVIVIISGIVTFAQKKPENPDKEILNIVKPKGCELNNIILENANSETSEGSNLILIARMGKEDSNKSISTKRLYTARAYLVEYNNLRKADSVITAEAPAEGKWLYGGVEIYVNGKFYDILTALPNEVLPLGSCDSPESDDARSRAKRKILYPWIYKNKSK